MTQSKKSKSKNFNVEIGLDNAKEWSDDKLAQIKAFVKLESEKRTPERKLQNELLSIRYQMEEYLEDNNTTESQLYTLEMFLQAYLKTLNFSFNKFATLLDTTDGNLKKYLVGDRKFNIDLAMKFGNFFHIPPELWLKVHIKNELIRLDSESAKSKEYKKYDYTRHHEIA